MTNYNLSATLDTSNLYEHPWYSQLQLLENTTTSESQLPPKLVRDKPGLTLTDSSRLGDIAEYVVITEALKRGANVYKNVGCTGKTDIVLEHNSYTLHIDVKVEKWNYKRQAFGSRGLVKATKPRVLVNPETWQVRWVKGKEPQNWETFWD